MTTMAQAIKKYVQSFGGKVASEQIKQAINAAHPGQWKASTLQAHLYACAANNPKAYIHHPSTEKFLYRNTDGTFEIYSEELHGPNEWAPSEGEDEVAEVSELVETSVSLERDIEDHLIHNLDWYAKSDGKPSRGILVAAEFPQGVRYAASAIPNLTLHAYKISFAFEQATI